MNKNLIIICIAIFFTTRIFAQAPVIQWQKSLGGTKEDIALSVQQTSDGGYIVTGRSYSRDGNVTLNNGIYDYWIVKLTSTGTIQWQKSLGGSSSDEAYSIQQTSDGGYIVAGESYSKNGDVTINYGNSDIWVVKLSNIGVIEWQKSYGGTYTETVNTIKQTADGGYIICGNTLSRDKDVTLNHGRTDAWIVKLSNDGVIQWQKSYGGSLNDYARSIQQTSDGGYIFAGQTESTNGDITENHGGFDVWVVKLNSNGGIQWQKTYGDSGYENAYSISQTWDGGYILAGTFQTEDGYVGDDFRAYDWLVLKLDSTGAIGWQKSLGGSNHEIAHSVKQTSDGEYIVAGYTLSNDGDVSGNHQSSWQDAWIVKLTTKGNIKWQKCLGGIDDDVASDIQQTADGGYIIAGFSESKGGDVSGNHGDFDYWVVKLGTETLGTSINIKENKILIENPVKDQLNIQGQDKITFLELYGMDGKVVKTSNSQNMSVKELPKGIYILKIQLENGKTISEKIIKE